MPSRGYQGASADYLRNQVAHGHDQGADRGHELNRLGVETDVKCVGEGVLIGLLERLGNHEQGYDPTGQVADGIQEPVVTQKGDHAANA